MLDVGCWMLDVGLYSSAFQHPLKPLSHPAVSLVSSVSWYWRRRALSFMGSPLPRASGAAARVPAMIAPGALKKLASASYLQSGH